MARKKQPTPSGFVLFDVLYQDGSRTSNRKVPATEVDTLDGEGPIRAFIEAQDRTSPSARAIRAAQSRASHAPRADDPVGGEPAGKEHSRLLNVISIAQLGPASWPTEGQASYVYARCLAPIVRRERFSNEYHP